MSSSRQVIATAAAPGAVGPYSQAIAANGLIFVSGQIGFDPKTMNLISDDVEGQADQVLKNLEAILVAAGSSLARVVKTTVLLADMDDFGRVNAIYAKYFPVDPPARVCYAVKTLPKNALVEIDAIALPNEPSSV